MLSVFIPEIDLIILTVYTPSNPILFIPHILLVPLDHLAGDIMFSLAPLIEYPVYVSFQCVLPSDQVFEIEGVCLHGQGLCQPLFIHLLLDLLTDKRFYC